MRQPVMFLSVTLLLVVKAATYSTFSAMVDDDGHRFLQTEGLDNARTRTRPADTANSKSTSALHNDDMSAPYESAVGSRVRRSVAQTRLEWPLVKRRGWGKRNWEIVVDGDELDVDQDAMTPELVEFVSGGHFDKRRGWGKRSHSRS